jgi:hypothetical protein
MRAENCKKAATRKWMQAFLQLEDDLINMAAATRDVTNKSAAHNAQKSELLLYFKPPTAGNAIFCLDFGPALDNIEFLQLIFTRVVIAGYTECSSNGLIYNNMSDLYHPLFHGDA